MHPGARFFENYKKQYAEVLLDRLDGLLLSGGHDVNPQLYGQQIKNSCGTLMPMRDEQDIALAKAAWKKGIPTLGICRGLQVMAVAFGGTMYQDVRLTFDGDSWRGKDRG